MPTPANQLFSGTPLCVSDIHFGAWLCRVDAKIRQDEGRHTTLAEYFNRTSHKYEVAGGVATIGIHGMISEEVIPIFDLYEIDYTVTPHLAAAIRQADKRDDVSSILIEADSPGGAVHGLQDAYEAIRDATKPVVVSVGGLLASAALYITAAADSIVASPTSMIGSIGTMTYLDDMSEMFARYGIKRHLVSTGPQKGAGTPGTEVTAAHIDATQRIVDVLAEQFINAVAEGRGMTKEAVAALATGDVWIGQEAVEAGLADAVASDPLAAASTKAQEIRKERNMPMSKQELRQALAAHPQHAELIASIDDQEGSLADVEAAVQAATKQAEITALQTRAENAEAALAEANASHASAIAEMQAAADDLSAKLAEANAKIAKLEPMSKTVDPGASEPPKARPKTITRAEAQSGKLPADVAAAIVRGEIKVEG